LDAITKASAKEAIKLQKKLEKEERKASLSKKSGKKIRFQKQGGKVI
jgi:hypothetical protein